MNRILEVSAKLTSEVKCKILCLCANGALVCGKATESACQCRRHKRLGFDPQVRKGPWRRKWQPIAVFLLGKSHGQRNPVSYSLQGHKESTEETQYSHTHTYIYITFFSEKSQAFFYKETKNSCELIILILCVNDYCYFTTKNVSTFSVKQKLVYLTKYRRQM